MKRMICVLTAALILISLAACGPSADRPGQGGGKTVEDVLKQKMNETTQNDDAAPPQTTGEQTAKLLPVDVDLTEMSSTMVYSEVLNMMSRPDDYLGRRVRMNGVFNVYKGDTRYYFACIISDATACCAQGIEFVLKDEKKYPDEYPTEGIKITVSGVFDTYYEGEYRYCQLKDAVIE